MPQFWGKYRGVVVDNLDLMELGRIQVSVPRVLGDVLTAWAMPCVPYAGAGVGFYMMPPIEGAVWVEFEGGDPDYPIWSGCFWREGEVPAEPAIPTMRMIRTASSTLTFNDLDGEGGFSLTVSDPAVDVPVTIRASSTGLSITLAEVSIAMTEDGVTVSAEPGILSVTVEGISAEHGSAMISAVEPEVSINEGALTVL